MNDIAKATTAGPSTGTPQLISRFLRPADLPAAGDGIVEIARDRHGPDQLLAALRTLTPGKVFHNVYEVWVDTVDHVDRRTARMSGQATPLVRL